MTKHRYWNGLLFAGLVVLIILSKNTLFDQTKQIEIIPSIYPLQAYYHAPISLNGNLEMDDFENKTGNGTIVSPYLISNLTITGGDVFDTIILQNIDRYLILFNCTIIDSAHYGIKIVSCSNLQIENCTFFGSSTGGLRIEYCGEKKLTIINNSINNNGDIGISVYSNTNIYLNLTQNQISGHLIHGIYIFDSDSPYILITQNNITLTGQYGIYLFLSDFLRLQTNSLRDQDYGIFMDNSQSVNMTSNSFFNHTYGIALTDNSIYTNINSSTIQNCTYGIYVSGNSYYASICNNVLSQNIYGIYITGTTLYHTIEYNEIIENQYGIRGGELFYSTIRDNILLHQSTANFSPDSLSPTNNITHNNLNSPFITHDYDATYSAGSTNNFIKWVMIDPDSKGLTYDILLNGVIYKSLSKRECISGEPIHVNIDGLKYGWYYFQLVGSDNWGGITYNNVTIFVSNVFPTITSTIANPLIIELLDDSQIVQWTVTDPSYANPLYNVTRNGVPLSGYINNPWGSLTIITVVLNGYSAGTYSFILSADDGYGGVSQHTQQVIVQNSPPFMQTNYANNTQIEIGQIPTQFQWNISDPSVSNGRLTIKLNDVVLPTYDNISWISPMAVDFEIICSIETVYKYTFLISDGLGTEVTKHFLLDIHNTVPVVSSPANILYEMDMAGNYIEWKITDPSVWKGNYTVWRNSTPYASYLNVLWSESLTLHIGIDSMEPGSYNFTIAVTDGYGGTDFDTVIVTVFNNLAPVIVAVESVTITENTRGNTITWIILDSEVYYPHYSISRDQIMIISGLWVSNQLIILPIDGLPIGTHNFTLLAIDGWGDSTQKVIMVIVRANTAPIISTVSDVTYTEGEIDHILSWHVEDIDVFYPYYQIYRNQLFIISGVWESNTTISLSVDGLTAGKYTVIITFYDGLGGEVEDKVIIHVLPKNPVELTATRWRAVGFVSLVVGGIGATLFYFIQSRRRWEI